MDEEFSQSAGHNAMTAGPILSAARDTIRAATAGGSLQAIRTALDWVEDGGFRFPVRWVDALARKPRRGERPASGNPFLPWDPALEVGPAGPRHVILLNKFPVMDCHLLVITRQFVDQGAPLDGADFAAILPLMDEAGGFAFYNGGRIAGASQPHRHLQWIPRDDVNRLPLLPAIEAAARQGDRASARLPYPHAIAPMPAPANASRAEGLCRTYRSLCAQLGVLRADSAPLPYNLLMTTDAMCVVSRRQECVRGISVNSLGFAGSLFVPEPDMIERIRQTGPLGILAAVAGLAPSGGDGHRSGR